MLVLRIGESSAPIDLDCSLCGQVLPAREKFPIIETQASYQDSNVEYETLCPSCLTTLKGQAIKFKIPIEFDIEPAPGTRLMVGGKPRND